MVSQKNPTHILSGLLESCTCEKGMDLRELNRKLTLVFFLSTVKDLTTLRLIEQAWIGEEAQGLHRGKLAQRGERNGEHSSRYEPLEEQKE